MPIPWGIIIALFVLGLAYLIKHFFAEVIENEHAFMIIIGGFLTIYIFAAIAIGSLNPFSLISNPVFADPQQLNQ